MLDKMKYSFELINSFMYSKVPEQRLFFPFFGNHTTIKYILSLLLLFSSLFYLNILQAQPPKVSATLSAYEITIGDPIFFKLEAAHAPNVSINWPLIAETVGGLEVLEVSGIDTLEATDALIKEVLQVEITAFDTGFYQIPRLTFDYTNVQTKKGGGIKTEPLAVLVSAPKIDLEGEIKAIKPPIETPLTWKEMLPYIIGGIIALLLLVLLLYLIRKYINRHQIETAPPPPPRPPHEVALEKLTNLDQQKYWQQGQVKLYYSELTDIVREYIEKRYGIQALEMTTDEILAEFKGANVRKSLLKKLEDMLILSDFVKFAKSKPSIDEHSKHLNGANEFVRRTLKGKEEE